MTSMGFPNTFPPKSSTAILTVMTEPSPVISEVDPAMSVNTPIFTTPSDILSDWATAEATPHDNKMPQTTWKQYRFLATISYTHLVKELKTYTNTSMAAVDGVLVS